MSKLDPWKQVVKTLHDLNGSINNPLDPTWIICYNDGSRNLLLNHSEANLEEVLQVFEDFCKGAGFIFDGFAIVDEDGIPVHGLNSIAKLEDDENKSS